MKKKRDETAQQLPLFTDTPKPAPAVPAPTMQSQELPPPTSAPAQRDAPRTVPTATELHNTLRGWAGRREFPRITYIIWDGERATTGVIADGEPAWREWLEQASYADLTYVHLSAGAYDIEARTVRPGRPISPQALKSMRAWVYEQGQAYGFPRIDFLVSGYYCGVILAGEARWSEVLRGQDAAWMISAVEWLRSHAMTNSTLSRQERILMEKLSFKQYRKVTPSRLRVLTERDVRERGGIIQTRECQSPFTEGDYLGKDSEGEFPIRRSKVERDFHLIGTVGADGWADYHAIDVRLAAQLPEAYDLTNGQHGEAGDYLVCGSDSMWIVARDQFEAVYQQQ